jgi:hypothetical protein
MLVLTLYHSASADFTLHHSAGADFTLHHNVSADCTNVKMALFLQQRVFILIFIYKSGLELKVNRLHAENC